LVSECCRPDGQEQFNESTCIHGGLGQFEAKYLMPLALANAGRLSKYGA
jgi:2,3-bisphosphoglycerate-independent phosphoglycerate mutase